MRWVLVLIAFISLSLIAFFPATYSILKGTHTVTNISSATNDISCTSCHSRIAQELNNSAYHSTLNCEDCHRNPYLGQKIAYDNGTVKSGEIAHAAIKPRCLDCHSQTSITLANGTTIAVPSARAFNQTNYGSDYSAHKRFVLDALNSTLGVGENEACLSCHSGLKVNITFSYPEYVNVSIYTDGTSTDGLLYSIKKVEFGPLRTYTITLNKNGSIHKLIPISNITCVSCHKNIYLGGLGSSLGRQHAGDVTDKGNDPAIHQTMPVNNDWCLSCHFNQTFASYPSVHSDEVHSAEKIQCVSCHSPQGPYPPSNETPSRGHHNSTYFYPQFQNYPQSAQGDICISCHVSNNHNLDTTGCGCHNSGYYINSTIYREPKANETPIWIIRTIN